MEPNTRFVLGRYQVDLARRTVADGDTAVDIHWRSFEALRALIKANGEVVEKEKLFETLWPGVTVDESNLHKYMTKLRKALNAADPGKEYVETVPRVGYRLGVVLRPADEADLAPVPPPAAQREVKSRPAISRARLSAGLLGMGLILGAGFWWMHRESGAKAEFDERAYQNAMNLIRERALPQVRLGTDALRRLVQDNPRIARAWAGLAEASILLEPMSPDAAIDHAVHGIRIDSECAECHAILGYLLFSTKWKWDEGGSHLSKAIALKPADSQIQLWLAQHEAALGRTRQAVEIMDRTARQFPEASNLGCSRAHFLYLHRDYDGAIRESDRLSAMNVSCGLEWKSNALFQLGQNAEAIYALHGFLGSWSSASAETIAHRKSAAVLRYESAGLAGALGDLLELVARPAVHAHNRARWWMLLGKHERAIEALQVALRVRLMEVVYLNVDPNFDPIRSRPEFREILRAVGLERPPGETR